MYNSKTLKWFDSQLLSEAQRTQNCGNKLKEKWNAFADYKAIFL